MQEEIIQKSKCGGARKGAGAPKKLDAKVVFNTRLPPWVKDWLVSPDRNTSAPKLIEYALRKTFSNCTPPAENVKIPKKYLDIEQDIG